MSRILSPAVVDTANSPYQTLGLSDNPFPGEGFTISDADDPRINGTIYDSTVRGAVQREFETRLLGVGNPEQRSRLGYLWAGGDLSAGRGVGKTALLLYLRRHINIDWGESYFGGTFPVAALYVYPWPRMRLEDIAIEALRELSTQGVLDTVLTTLRFAAICADMVEGDVEAVRSLSPNEGGRLLDEAWLQSHGFDPIELSIAVLARLTDAGVSAGFALAVAEASVPGYLQSLRPEPHVDHAALQPRDTLFRKANALFYTDAVLTLKAAGFRGLYLFVDDIENLVDNLTRKAREAWAKELGYILFRGDYAAAVSRFVSFVLTTHAGSAELLSEAWGRAGFASVLPMSLDAPNSILVPTFTLAESKAVVRRYIDFYRLDGTHPIQGLYHPFTEEAVTAIVQQSNYHPREFLSQCKTIVEAAVKDPLRTVIDATFVAAIVQERADQRFADQRIDVTQL